MVEFFRPPSPRLPFGGASTHPSALKDTPIIARLNRPKKADERVVSLFSAKYADFSNSLAPIFSGVSSIFSFLELEIGDLKALFCSGRFDCRARNSAALCLLKPSAILTDPYKAFNKTLRTFDQLKTKFSPSDSDDVRRTMDARHRFRSVMASPTASRTSWQGSLAPAATRAWVVSIIYQRSNMSWRYRAVQRVLVTKVSGSNQRELDLDWADATSCLW
ncbi:hypothetical protein RRG08_034946 [Elysia crispata]|uniref:Uncharacterized protein n=1 Tax=Elysia crispata TaxID=231223 RepID=A0AAE0Y2J1_9GAST|nr:hypothetical protein RRG08_034946 [Elysia crispata]